MASANSQQQAVWRQAGRDALLAFSLMAALLVVYGLDAFGNRSAESEPATIDAVFRPVKATEPVVSRLRIGVTPDHYEHMGELLDSLGKGYSYERVSLEDMLDDDKLKKFDVLFFTCGWSPREWLGELVREGDRPNTELRELKPRIGERMNENLRQFVAMGGTLYASDFRFPFIAQAFTEYIAEDQAALRGDVQTVRAEVTNDELQRLLGSHIELDFDQPSWFPAAFDVEGVFLKGRFKTMSGTTEEAPLLVKFPVSKGHVVYTAFHNDHQDSGVVRKLLRFLIFATVTADTEAAVTESMLEGGFSPRGSSILSTSPEQAVAQTYECTNEGPLQFALAFRKEQGAKFRLTVVSPSGSMFDKEGDSSFIIEVPTGEIGDWECKVTATSVPYRNFPFTLTIGEKQ